MTTDHLLIMRGPVGVGKTTVAGALSDVLAEREVAHAVLDLDALCQSWPRVGRWNEPVAMANLATVCSVYRSYGISNFVVSGAAETPEAVATIATNTGASHVTVCGLYASLDSIRHRLRQRIRSDAPLSWYESRATELLAQLRTDGIDNLAIETDQRIPADLAREVATHLGWHPTQTAL